MPPFSPIRILIIDEERTDAEALSRSLADFGHVASVLAERGPENIASALATSPDLVLVDLQLARALSAIREPEALSELYEVPFLFRVGASEPEAARATDPSRYIPKQCSPRELHAAVRAAMLRHQLDRRAAPAPPEKTAREPTAVLQDAHPHLHDLIENVSDLIQSVGPDGRFHYVNRAWRATLGYTPDDLRSLRMFDVVDPSCQDACHAIFRRLMEGHATGPFEMIFRARDGRRVLVEGNVTVRFEAGKPIATRGIFRDVTSRRFAEEEYTAIVRANMSGFMMVDHEARILEANPAFCALLGYTAEELRRLRIPDIEAVESAEDTRRHIARILETGNDRFETRHRRKDGSVVDVEISAQYLPIRGGVFIGFVSDLTAKRAVHAAQQRNLEFLTALNQTTLELLSSRDRAQLLEALARRASVLLGADSTEVALLEGDDFVICAAHGRNAPGKGTRMPRAEAVLSSRAIKTRAPVVTENYPGVPQANASYLRRNIRAIAVLPFLLADQSTGVLRLLRTAEQPPFSADDLRHAELLASLAALILHNASVYDDACRIAEERSAALRASEERFRAIFDQSPLPIVLSTLPDGQIVDANPAFSSAIGVPREAMVGRTGSELGIGIDETTRQTFIRELIENGAVSGLEVPVKAGSTSRKDTLVYARLLHLNGQLCSLATITDITRQKQVENALSESHLLLRTVLDSAPIGIWLQDDAGRMRFVNRAYCESVGIPEARFLSVPHYAELYDAATAAACMASDRVARESATPCVSHEHVNFIDGQRHELEVHKARLMDSEGRFRGIVGLALDVTEKRRIQAALADSEARLREAQRLALIGNWEFDCANRNFRWCDTLAEIFEIPPARPRETQATFLERVHPGDRERVDRARRESMESRAPYEIEHRLLFPDGRLKHVLHRGAYSCSPEGEIQRAFGTLQDITIRKKAEDAALRTARQFQDLFEFAPDAILMADREGRIVRINRRAEALLGYTREELLDASIETLVPEAFREQHLKHRAHFVAHPSQREMGQRNLPLHARRKDGSVFPAQISLGPIQTEDGFHVIAGIRDITEQLAAEETRKRVQTQLARAQKLESLGTLAGGVAHDFNNILTGILGFAEVAKMDLPSSHPASATVEHIVTAANRAKALVKQILTFSRKHPSDLRPTNLRTVVTEACDLVRKTIPPTVELRHHVAAVCPPILADANQIHQIVINLCTNAWHALPAAGGQITVNVQPVTSPPGGAEATRSLVRLVVSDNGSGMEAATRERVFEPFFTTKQPGHGSGLGLSVVHGIVQAHSASIGIESAPGSGTTVQIDFPALSIQEMSAEAAAAPRPLPRGAGQSVLVVDDDVTSGEALRHLAERLGYRVTFAADGIRALALFREAPAAFDLVLTDYSMPAISGTQLATEMRRVRPLLPVILVSGNFGREDLTALDPSQFRVLLSKPPTLADLATALECALSGGR